MGNVSIIIELAILINTHTHTHTLLLEITHSNYPIAFFVTLTVIQYFGLVSLHVWRTHLSGVVQTTK